MKKNFFKKLSFVIALAMIISTIAPAAGALAATKIKLNSTKKYLHLAVDGLDDYNFNIVSKKGTGWKYSWETSNDDVVVVDEKSGVVTAAGVGTAKVTVFIVDKDGNEVGDATATVVVRDNIKEVTIANKPAGDKVSVGVAQDFNRDFVTVSGNKKVTSSVTKWTLSPETGATIDAKGVFTATVAGEYTITASAYQSKTATTVLDTDTYKVTVPVEIKEIKQVNKTKFTAEFNTDVSKTLTKDNAFVYQVINGKNVATGTEKIKSVAFDGNKVTVEIYGNIVSKTVYNFAFGDTNKSFTGANTDMSEVAGIVFDDFTVAVSNYSGQDLTAKVSGVNKDGVVIRTGAEIASNLTFSYGGDVLYGWVSGNYAGINKSGYEAVLTAKYSNFVLDTATNTYKTVTFEDQAKVTGVTVAVNSSTMQFTVKKNAAGQLADGTWPTTPGLAVPAGDSNYNLHVRYRNNTDNSWDPWRYSNGEFTFVSTDADKLVINNNYLYPIAQGVVTVLVKSGNDVINTFDVTVMAGRSFATATADTQMVALGNKDMTTVTGTSANNESKNVVIWAKDSMNEGVVVSATVDSITGPVGAVNPQVSAVPSGAADEVGKVNVGITATNSTPGAYYVKIKLTGLNSSKTVDVYVTVLDSNEATQGGVVRWAVEADKAEYDMKKLTLDGAGEVKSTVYVYGYNKNNARIRVLQGSYYDLTVKRGTTDISSINGSAVADNAIVLAKTSGGAISFVDFDTYVVTAVATGGASNPTNRADGAQIGATSFIVKDTTTKVMTMDTLSVKFATDADTVAEVVDKAFNFKINDADVESAISTIVFSNGGAKIETAGTDAVSVGQNIYIESVKIPVSFDGGTNSVYYKIDVNRTITITN